MAFDWKGFGGTTGSLYSGKFKSLQVHWARPNIKVRKCPCCGEFPSLTKRYPLANPSDKDMRSHCHFRVIFCKCGVRTTDKHEPIGRSSVVEAEVDRLEKEWNDLVDRAGQ